MQTITVELINEKAIKLLEDMEMLQLIRLKKETFISGTEENPIAKFSGIRSGVLRMQIQKKFQACIPAMLP